MEIKNIIGYEEQYSIDINGRIYGKKYKKYLKPQINTMGYYKVSLSKNGEVKQFLIHRLIAEHFIDNPDNLPTVDHVDGRPLNNNITNLRWATQSEQVMNRGIRSDNSSGFTGVYFFRGKYVARIQIDGKNKHLGTYDTPEEASEVYQAEATILFGKFKRQV